jgi:transcriptional regulator
MYVPTQFASQDLDQAIDLMKAHSFATLITNDDEGWPYVSYLPLHVEKIAAEPPAPQLVLFGHVAKANPHWRYLRDRGTAVVSFLGPHAYMSPRVYPDKKRVPTWNYLAVQCRVTVRIIEGHDATDGMLVKMIEDYESGYLAQWRSMDEHYVKTMLAGIVGFELSVTELQCKLKLNQHRPESHAAMRDAYAGGNDNERELVHWMERIARRDKA